MQIFYTLRMPVPDNHYFEVEMKIEEATRQTTLKMATWTPGSYLIREYARNVEGVEAKTADGKSIAIRKISKNTWVAENGKSTSFSVTYRVYANEMAVRNCYLDAEHGYLNGAAVFLYAKGAEQKKAGLKVELPAGWSKVITALEPVGTSGTEFKIENLDELIDSPILCGNPTLIEFEAAGIPHRVAMQGPGNYKADRIKEDFKKIIETEKAVFQHHPCKNYTFIVHNLPAGGGGLEHMNSTSLQTAYNTYDNETSYSNFLSLVAHEYFHLWNVKRLRPKPLGPFDYENENYTTLLWVAEGFTAYYDDFFMFRSGLTKRDKFLDIVGSNISRVESVPGMYVQTLAEASLDAWIKYYRPNENSGNSNSDYYTKGAAIATMLDMMLIQESKGKLNLDNLLRDMYNHYYLKLNVGFTESDLEKELAARLGAEKAKTFLNRFVYGLERPDWAGTLAAFGIKLTDRTDAAPQLSLGLKLQGGGKPTVQSLLKTGPAFTSGIYVGDEIISIGNRRVESADVAPILAAYNAGDKVQVLFARNGQLKSTEIVLMRDPIKSYRLDWLENATPEQDMLRRKWLRMP